MSPFAFINIIFCVYKYILYFSQLNDKGILSVFDTPYKISVFDKFIFFESRFKATKELP